MAEGVMIKPLNICLLQCILLVLLTGCGRMMQQKEMEGDITGAWVRTLPGNMGIEGFFLYPDKTLRFVNIFSMQGDSWAVTGDKLTLYSHTERYPQPEARTYQIESTSGTTMVLSLKGGKIEYRRPLYSKDIREARWLAVYVPGPPAKAEPDQEVFFSLQRNGIIEGFAGCNNFRGSYLLTGQTIKFGPLLATKMYCPAMAVENNLFKALEEAKEFLVVEDQLYLYKGKILQGFFKAQENE